MQQNFISKIENLGTLKGLHTLNLAQNRLVHIENLKGILDCPTISVLDLQNNKIESPEIVDLLEQMPDLRVLYLIGNPLIRNISNYRKALIARIKSLTHLDDRPVFIEERRTAEAWYRGGLEAERHEREQIEKEKNEKEQRNWEAFSKLITQGKSEKERFAKYEEPDKENIADLANEPGERDIFDELEEKELKEATGKSIFITERTETDLIASDEVIGEEANFQRVHIEEGTVDDALAVKSYEELD